MRSELRPDAGHLSGGGHRLRGRMSFGRRSGRSALRRPALILACSENLAHVVSAVSAQALAGADAFGLLPPPSVCCGISLGHRRDEAPALDYPVASRLGLGRPLRVYEWRRSISTNPAES
jgi:hypothetical protein